MYDSFISTWNLSPEYVTENLDRYFCLKWSASHLSEQLLTNLNKIYRDNIPYLACYHDETYPFDIHFAKNYNDQFMLSFRKRKSDSFGIVIIRKYKESNNDTV